jgi:hypothetical protein
MNWRLSVKVGDLVKPRICCTARLNPPPGCDSALIIEARYGFAERYRVLCKCGLLDWRDPKDLKLINESR